MAGSICKRGDDTYRLSVSMGTDEMGKPIRFTKTVHVTTKKAAEKELAEFYLECCEAMKHGSIIEGCTVEEFADIWWTDYGENAAEDVELIAGINTVLSSFTADFLIRQRIAKNVNAFIVKAIPVPRDLQTIRELGRLSLPLYDGDDFDAFRGEITALTDPALRDKLIAKLDARTAHLYQLTYEEYQAVLATFPLVEGAQKKRCLQAYNEWMFSLEAEGK